ncbi:hypothetical protein LUZ60_004052 [Juncus effusus]|nr:hypothetical protein LUZ60_004052 [Juncus effusus]
MDPTHKLNRSTNSKASSSLRRCLFISLFLLLCTAFIIIILCLTVLKPRQSTTIVNSVHLSGLHFSLLSPSLSLSLNLTLSLNITARNPNHASFRYTQGTAKLFYKENLVGFAEIPAGDVEAEGEVNTLVDLTIMAGELAGDSEAYGDFIAGSMDFRTETEIPGRVTVLGVLKHHMVTYSSCDVIVGIRSNTVENSNCSQVIRL